MAIKKRKTRKEMRGTPSTGASREEQGISSLASSKEELNRNETSKFRMERDRLEREKQGRSPPTYSLRVLDSYLDSLESGGDLTTTIRGRLPELQQVFETLNEYAARLKMLIGYGEKRVREDRVEMPSMSLDQLLERYEIPREEFTSWLESGNVNGLEPISSPENHAYTEHEVWLLDQYKIFLMRGMDEIWNVDPNWTKADRDAWENRMLETKVGSLIT